MKTSTKRAVWMASILALANWAATGADMSGSPRSTEGTSRSSDMNGGSPRSTDMDSSQRTTAGSAQNDSEAGAQPQEYNKASSIVGMDVQNQQGEHLGHIKDIVFDLNSQRVSYAVLTTASKALPIDEKLLAVPLNAFTVSADQKHLILNADKSKVESAAGFSSKNWPNVGNPTWGAEPFWQQNNNGSGTTPRGPAPGQNQRP